MEAATTSGPGLLPRDGAVPAAPAPAPAHALVTEAIDGVTRCGCCGRFPLIGETVIRRQDKRGPSWACERCEAAGRGAGAGPALGRARIRSLGGALNVRRAV